MDSETKITMIKMTLEIYHEADNVSCKEALEKVEEIINK